MTTCTGPARSNTTRGRGWSEDPAAARAATWTRPPWSCGIESSSSSLVWVWCVCFASGSVWRRWLIVYQRQASSILVRGALGSWSNGQWPMGSCCFRTAAIGVAIPLESTSGARGRVVRHAAATRVTPVQVRASAPGTSSTRVEAVLTKRSWWVRFPRSRPFATGEPIRRLACCRFRRPARPARASPRP